MTKLTIQVNGNSVEITDDNANSLRWDDQFENIKEYTVLVINQLKH